MTEKVERSLHLAADCTSGEGGPFDVAILLERLLLFERYTIRTNLCRDVDGMVRHLGVVPTTQLIEAGAVRIHDAASTVGLYNLQRSSPLQYDIRFVARPEGDTEHLQRHIEALTMPGATVKAAKRLKGLLAQRAIATQPTRLGGLDDTMRDLRDRKDLVRAAVVATLRRRANIVVDDFAIEVKGPSSEHIVVETDLCERLSLQPADLHEHIGKALLSIGKVNLELSFMNDLDAVGAISEHDEPVLSRKVEGLAASAGKERQNLTRVLQITGLPDIRSAHSSGSLNVLRYLKAVQSDEGREFRAWIRSSHALTDADLKRMLSPLRIKALSWQFKVLMLAIGVVVPGAIGAGALGAAAGAGAATLTGVGLSALDAFVLQKLLAVPGPVAFLRRTVGKTLGGPGE